MNYVDGCKCSEVQTNSAINACQRVLYTRYQTAVLLVMTRSFLVGGYIQGDSGGICTTLGNYSISDFKQKSSYEHGSDFERFRSYGHFLFPIHDLM
jgi:hypothetical protein